MHEECKTLLVHENKYSMFTNASNRAIVVKISPKVSCDHGLPGTSYDVFKWVQDKTKHEVRWHNWLKKLLIKKSHMDKPDSFHLKTWHLLNW